MRMLLLVMLTCICGCSHIQGKVTVDGKPLPNAEMLLAEFGVSVPLQTNAAGQFIATVPYHWSGTMTLVPYNATISYQGVTSDHLNQDWEIVTQFATISGVVTDKTDPNNFVPVAGVSMNADGATSRGDIYNTTSTTDASGMYLIKVPVSVSITIQNYSPPIPPLVPSTKL